MNFVEADEAISEFEKDDKPIMINVRNILYLKPHFRWADVTRIFLRDGYHVDVRGEYSKAIEVFK